MINLGVIDILLLLVLVGTLFRALRTHNLLPFFIVLFVILLIELERLIPGTMAALGNGIRSIDVVNEKLPHIQISPIITIKP
jgi:hypothetical protein